MHVVVGNRQIQKFVTSSKDATKLTSLLACPASAKFFGHGLLSEFSWFYALMMFVCQRSESNSLEACMLTDRNVTQWRLCAAIGDTTRPVSIAMNVDYKGRL